MTPSRLLTIGFFALVLAGWSLAAYYTFQPGSRVWVEGTSTVHEWTCEAHQVVGTITGEDALTDGMTALSVTVPLQRFDCGNGTMNGKMRDALQAKANPAIRYTLTTANLAKPDAEGWFDVNTTGKLSIAGKTRTVSMKARGKAVKDGAYRFTGSTDLKMTDFGIDPPTAMLGTLKTGDAITVHFDVTAGR